MGAPYYNYQLQQWVEQSGDREIMCVGSDGTIYYVDEQIPDWQIAETDAD